MNKELMFSSKTDLWSTPQDLFDKYNEIYHFETDVCALPENAKCKKFFTPEIDGWISILQRQQNGEYEPKIQAKDEPHAKGYIDMIEPLTIPANIL